jgi:hypothetical protein
MAAGAVIEVRNGDIKQKRRIGCGEGFSSQNSYSQFFGLGENEFAELITVTWPNGLVTTHEDIPANQRITIYEQSTIVTGCTNELACNFLPDANVDDGSCYYAETYHDCAGVCLADEDGDGICDELEIPGCTDELACNYDPLATDENDSCTYPVEFYKCNGDCISDEDLDGVCDQLEIAGCTDPFSCNYDPAATDNNGSCIHPLNFYDCEGNCNSDEDEDGVCDQLEIPGCTNPAACNYNSNATDSNGSCIYAAEYYDCDGNCLVDTDEDGVCDSLEISGCTDPEACNYNEDASEENGSCTYPWVYYDCDNNCLHDDDGDGLCNEWEVYGCTDLLACNYNPDATEEDESCEYIFAYLIGGTATPTEYTTETYSYQETLGSSYHWTALNGDIISGEGSPTIEVTWDNGGGGFLSVTETNTNLCLGPTVHLNINVITGVEEVDQSNIRIFPNPASDIITIDAGNWAGKALQVQITDMSGRVVWSEKSNQTLLTIYTTDLPNGIYSVIIRNENDTVSRKLAVMK